MRRRAGQGSDPQCETGRQHTHLVAPPPQAARVIANLIVAGAGVLIRAGVQAYRQAIVSE